MTDRIRPPPSYEDIADGAAFLIVLLEDPRSGPKRHVLGEEVKDALAILRRQCEQRGLFADFPQDAEGRYRLWDSPRRERTASHAQGGNG